MDPRDPDRIDPDEAEEAAAEARQIADTLRFNGVFDEASDMDAMALQLEQEAKRVRWRWFRAALMAQKWVRGRRGRIRAAMMLFKREKESLCKADLLAAEAILTAF